MAGPSSIYEGTNPLKSSTLDLFIIQLIIVVILSKVLSYAFKYVKQPSVIAEVITGILLGPSVMGFVPGFTDNIFPASSINTFNVIANIGLILFMFLVGLEVDANLMRRNLRGSAIISVTAMVVPFALGIGASAYMWYEMPRANSATFASFLLFVGVAVAITAFPVLARILTDQGLTHSKVGIIALSSAAVDDVTAWICLALVVSIARSSGSLVALYTLLVFAGYVLVMLIVMRPILKWASKHIHARDTMKHEFVIIILILLFVSAWTTDVIGVHSMFGGFFLGVITPRENGFALRMTERIEDLIMVILVPLYFTYSGLRTDLSTLNTWEAGVTVILVIAVSMLGKIGGATIASRFLGNSWRDSVTIGVLLNCKGLVELVVLNVGLDIGVLTPQIFAAFVVMAIWNTLLTTPLVWFLWVRHEKRRNPLMRKSTDYSVMVCIPEARIGVSMMTIGGALVKAHALGTGSKRKPRIHAVHLKEISERPSTYFFAMRLDKSDAVEFARQRASILGLNFKVTARASTDIAKDISRIANSNLQDLVVLGWNRRESDSIDEGGSVVHHLMQHIRAPVGIFVDKGRLRDRTTVERALLVYSFHEFEAEAVKVALELARDPNVHLTVVVPRREWLMREGERRSFTLESLAAEPEAGELSKTRPHHVRDSAADRQTTQPTSTTSRKRKRRSWVEYFDIIVLLGLLRDLLRRIFCSGPTSGSVKNSKHSSGGGGPDDNNAEARSRSNSDSSTTGSKGSDIEMEEVDASRHDSGRVQQVLRKNSGKKPNDDVNDEADLAGSSTMRPYKLEDNLHSMASALSSVSGDDVRAAGTASSSALPFAFNAEQKRTEEELMKTFEGVVALVHAKGSDRMSLIVSEDDDVLQTALDQEARHVYQVIIIGNERKWSRRPNRLYHHLNLHLHHRPHIRFGRHRNQGRKRLADDDVDDSEGRDDHEDDEDEDSDSVQFSDLVGSSTTSLLVVHPPLKTPDYVETRSCFDCIRNRRTSGAEDDADEEISEDAAGEV